jgi:hypothetical protein
MNKNNRKLDANLQPLTRAPRAGPACTGIAAVVGGLAGEGVAEAINPTLARAYGGDDISGRDYVEKGSSLDKCGPAYDFGVDARGRYPGRDFDDIESEMSSDWAASRVASILNWGWAKHAAREAWNRISRSSSLCA